MLQNSTIVEGPGQGEESPVSSSVLRFFLFQPLATSQTLDLLLVPPPQVRLHADQSPHSLHEGSGRHGCSLHASVTSD